MARFIFMAALLLIAVSGIASFFFIDIKISQGDETTTIDDSNSLIIKDDFRLRSILQRIASSCPENDKECLALSAYRYVQNDIALSDKLVADNSPDTVLRLRQGGALGRSILLASFLENGGVDSAVSEDGAVIRTLACGLDTLKMYDVLVKDARKNPLAEKDLTLNKAQTWAVSLKNKENIPINIDVTAKGSKPFDMILFPNDTEMRAYIKRKDGRFLEECSVFGSDNASLSCLAPAGSLLAFISKDDGNIFSSVVYRGGLLLSDIKSVRRGGDTCIPIDVSNINEGGIGRD